MPCLAIPRHNGLATAQLDRSLGVEGCRAQCRPHGLTGLAAKFKCAGVSCILRVPVGSSTVQIHSAQGACASPGALAHDLRFPAPSTQCCQTVREGETASLHCPRLLEVGCLQFQLELTSISVNSGDRSRNIGAHQILHIIDVSRQ